MRSPENFLQSPWSFLKLPPVTWEFQGKRLWPVCAPESGRVERWQPLPFPGATQSLACNVFFDTFEKDGLRAPAGASMGGPQELDG